MTPDIAVSFFFFKKKRNETVKGGGFAFGARDGLRQTQAEVHDEAL